MVLRASVCSPYASSSLHTSALEFFKINNEILPPHTVPGVTEEIRSSVHSTSMQFQRNFLNVFAQRKTENVRTTVRQNITLWNFAGIFFRTSFSQSCVCSLHYQCSQIASVKFPAAQISVGVYAYAFTRNIRTGVLFALSGWFFHRWCNKLWATCCFFYFFDSRCSRLVTGLISLLKTIFKICSIRSRKFSVFSASC